MTELLDRLLAGDASLWPPGNVAPNRLGWLDVPRRMADEAAELQAFAQSISCDRVVLYGMGGSSLAPEVVRRCFTPAPEHPRLHVLDSTDAAAVRAVGEAVAPARTLFIVPRSSTRGRSREACRFQGSRSAARFRFDARPSTFGG